MILILFQHVIKRTKYANKFLLLILLFNFAYTSECSPYFNPQRFYDAPEYLEKLLAKERIDSKIKQFNIKEKELYRFYDYDIANEINEKFGEFWNDWIEDGYEMKLTPESTLFKYKNYYLSLEIYIYGVKGDATKLKYTLVKYHFYNYTKEVNKYIICKRNKK